VRFPRAVAQAMEEHARRGFPFEVCGILVGRDGACADAIAVENRETAAPRVRYEIAPEDLLRVQRESRARGLEIVGYYHSHPDHPARPSETDRRIAAEGLSDGLCYVVVGVQGGTETLATAWIFRDADQAFAEEPFEIV
jgi:proteasome lid subunit RPN8/RPN11